MLSAAAFVFVLGAALRAQDGVDPALRAAVERFYAVQESENVADYLSLWATGAQRPQPAQLKYAFDTGDDKFSELQIRRVTRDGDRAAVRVSIARDRTMTAIRRPDGSSPRIHSTRRRSTRSCRPA
jgi:hypothetical protein